MQWMDLCPSFKTKIMFTINQIKEVHSKVKSGADFPAYVQDLIQLGVRSYESHVADGHILFFGKDGYTVQSEAKYAQLKIADNSDQDQFKKELKEHQQGKTDYLAFCTASARSGIEKWVVDTVRMTCTYYDKAGREILVEEIPDS
jgi:uncharacterized protein YbcV (DUF1398 family)